MRSRRCPRFRGALAAGWIAVASHVAGSGLAVAQDSSTLPNSARQASNAPLDLARLHDVVVEATIKNFYDPRHLASVGWQERAAAARQHAAAASSVQEAVQRINALLGELKTSHTGLFTPDQYEYYILLDIVGVDTSFSSWADNPFFGNVIHYPGIGIFTREIDGRHFVDGVLQSSPAEKAGLLYGDEMIAVDGRPYSPIAAFRGKIGGTVKVEYRRHAGGAVQAASAAVVPIVPSKAFVAATAASARTIERHGKRIGYVHVWASSDSSGFNSALSRLASKAGDGRVPAQESLDHLIVDMRGRVGGNSNVASSYLEALDRRSRPFWGNTRTINRPEAPVRNYDPFYFGGMSAPHARFHGRSTLLINHHTRSAAEIMAHGFKRGGFGTVVGTTTAGAVTSGRLFLMPGDLVLYVAVLGFEFDGQPLEGTGVLPDVRVERPLPYAAGADPVLEAALERLAGPP